MMIRVHAGWSAFLLLVVCGALLPGCSSSSEGGSTGDLGDGGGARAGSGGAFGLGSGGSGAQGSGAQGSAGFGGQTLGGLDASIVIASCGTAGCACSNGIDDDGDGLVDGFDPECTGPLDRDEATFATGIPGDNRDPKWQDCFFDGNSGAGDDRCRYATGCLTGELEQTDKNCTLTQACLDFCKPLVSNGCDCFGCCTVQTPGGAVDIQIGSACSLAKVGDAKACPVCKKSATCNNTCGTCELCPGKTVADLPASCTPPSTHVPDSGAPPPPVYTCDGGHAVCSAAIPCAGRDYCQQGCCVPSIR